jgi:hypothetical protein
LHTFVVKAVNPVDTRALVVAAENEKVFGVLDLVCKEQADGLETLLATIHIVTEEEIIGFWRETTVFEESQQVVVLPMDVT